MSAQIDKNDVDNNTEINNDNTATVNEQAAVESNSLKGRVIRIIADIIILGLLIGADRYTKYLAVIYLKDKPAYRIWDRVFELSYLENRGAAFGIMQNMKYFFLAVAIIMIIFVFYALIKAPNGLRHALIRTCLVLIGAGAVGNMIDRLTTEYVVDFFYFRLINFPIFNVADIYVTVACALLIIGILFIYKEDDLSFLKLKNK